MKALRWSRSMAARRGSWCRISTSGKAQSGHAASSSYRTTNRVFGRSSGTICTAIRGVSSDMPETDTGSLTQKLAWRVAEVSGIIDETPRVKSLVLDVPGWPGHRPGQHVDVRLTAEDGYQAQRSYSVASEPDSTRLMLTVELIEGGEVSPYLTSDVRPGDKFELRGPIGGYFVWTVAIGGPLFLVAGGSGIAPLMSMLRY